MMLTEVCLYCAKAKRSEEEVFGKRKRREEKRRWRV